MAMALQHHRTEGSQKLLLKGHRNCFCLFPPPLPGDWCLRVRGQAQWLRLLWGGMWLLSILHPLCKQKHDCRWMLLCDTPGSLLLISSAELQIFSSEACTYFQRTSSCSLMVPSSVISTMIAWGLVVKKFMLSHVTTPTRIVASPRSSVTCRGRQTYPFSLFQTIPSYVHERTSQAQICWYSHQTYNLNTVLGS